MKPGAKEQQFSNEGNELKVHLKASPVKGKANKKLISFLAKVFKLKKTDIEIVKGLKSRDKVISIMNCSIEYVRGILNIEY